jgi:hypothetical protein
MHELANFMKTKPPQSNFWKVIKQRRGPLVILDGANLAKEFVRLANPTLTANPPLCSRHFDVFEKIGVPFDFLVVNETIMSQYGWTTYLEDLRKSGRLLQISCSKEKSNADDFLCLYLADAFDGIVVSGDRHQDSIHKTHRPLISRLRYGVIKMDNHGQFTLGDRKPHDSGVVLAKADRLPSYEVLAPAPPKPVSAQKPASAPAPVPAHVTCAFCGKLGHGARYCPTWIPKPVSAHVTCAFCSKLGHVARYCPTWRPTSR